MLCCRRYNQHTRDSSHVTIRGGGGGCWGRWVGGCPVLHTSCPTHHNISGGVREIYLRKSRGFRKISCSEIYHHKIDQARPTPPSVHLDSSLVNVNSAPPPPAHQATLSPHAQGPAPAHTPTRACAYTQDDGIFRPRALRWGLVAVDSPLSLGTGQSGSSASWWGREGRPHPRACSCMRPPAQPNPTQPSPAPAQSECPSPLGPKGPTRTARGADQGHEAHICTGNRVRLAN